MAKTIAVIIPAYNASATILRALRSVNDQTWPVNEVIVIDDASKDQTQKILDHSIGTKQFKFNLKYLRMETNLGAASARNNGIKNVRSQFVAFLDADDVWLPNHIEVCMSILEAEGLFETAVVQKPLNPEDQSVEKQLVYRSFSALYYMFIQANCSMITLVTSKFLVEKAGLFPEGRRYGEDHYFFIRLFLCAKKRFYIVSPKTVRVCKHPYASSEGLSSKRLEMFLGTIRSVLGTVTFSRYFFFVPVLISWHIFKYAVRTIRVYKIMLKIRTN